MRVIDWEYEAHPTISRFHLDSSFIRGLMGPLGSGKSVGCCADLLKLAREQTPSSDGIRRTRWAIIRNTYRELHDTTMRTWFEHVPKDFGHWAAGDMEHRLKAGDFEAEFLFRALDRPDDVKKLLSLEFSANTISGGKELN